MNDQLDILLVEDDAELRESLAELLEEDGYRVVACEDGKEAMAHLRGCARPPALILLDLMMPGMNGWEFREHQRRGLTAADVPVVVMTASRNLADNPIDCREVLYKPLQLRTLLTVVARHAGRGAGA